MQKGSLFLLFGGLLTGVAALLHVAIIIGGPPWYRFFGAGERMAQLAASGSSSPALVTATIAATLGVWALYALSGAGVIRRLPFLRLALLLIAVIYLARGALGVPVVLFAFFSRLGFVLAFTDTPDSPTYAVVTRDLCELHLQWQDPSQWEGHRDRPTYRFLVADVDRLFQEFQAAGAAPDPAVPASSWAFPADTPWSTREFHLKDPAGNGLQFYRPV